uniref:Putative reverse transcriptase domain-containing protein n=1 Tax=Tanacetum cinerariifolium TaxID=118510 RepID=A0A6L2MPX2_TANCI|nr:putative reverse transcriptase domain-containing protein [Tanacetum cinerariifolium]
MQGSFKAKRKVLLKQKASDYDCEICYHPGKANVVADTLSRKERVKPKRVRAMNRTLQSSIKDRILAAQKEAVDEFARLQKGVVCFGKKENLAPRFVRPFEIVEKVVPVAYRLDLPEELNGVHDTFHMIRDVSYKLDRPEELSIVHSMFHVSNLKKCHADEPLAVPLDGLHFDDKLHFVEEPVEIVDREVKRLKRSRIPLVKVQWNSKRGPEFTWEREDQFRKKYPHLFARSASTSNDSREHQRHEDTISHVFDHGEVHAVFCCDVFGLTINFVYSKLSGLPPPKEIMDPLKRSTWFEQLPLKYGFVFRQRHSVVEYEPRMFDVRFRLLHNPYAADRVFLEWSLQLGVYVSISFFYQEYRHSTSDLSDTLDLEVLGLDHVWQEK